MFEVGQKVWCLVFGEGYISAVVTDDPYPVRARFKNGEDDSYTTDGKLFIKGKRSLYFSEPVITARETPPFVGKLEIGATYTVHVRNYAMFVAELEGETEDFIRTKGLNFSKQEIIGIWKSTPENIKSN